MAALAGCAAASASAADRHAPPKLPVTTHWTVTLPAGVTSAPVSDGERVFLALSTALVVAHARGDGHEVWRVARDVSAPMAASGGLLFLSAGEAIEALRTTDGASAWIAPRITATAPLVASGSLVIAATDTEIVAMHATNGQVAWRRPGGGIRHPAAIDGDRVFLGADDGRVLALDAASGNPLWEKYVPNGVTALGASRGLVYVGAGDKYLYCLSGRTGAIKWPYRVGSLTSGAIAVDDDHVYFVALDNVVRGLDRESGNQRWQVALNRRAVGGVRAAGRLVFVQVSGTEIVMLLDRDGRRSGTLGLPGETTREVPPEVRDTPGGLNVFAVTGSLANQWQLTLIGPAGEAALEPFARLTPLPGVSFLTDPLLVPIGRVLPWLVMDDPMLRPLSAGGWPVVLQDPPLEPLTTLPGLQLRPLSPALPVRRGG
jgi:outer membrane protein assembly factor BamB